MENVSKLIRSGFKWNTAYIIVSSILLPVSYLFLAKYMGKVEFGRLAIVMVYISLSDIITQFGLSQAIISKEKVPFVDLNSLFWANILIGLFLSTSGFLCANYVAQFYSDSELGFLLRIASIVFLLKQVPLIYKALLQKQMEFKVLAPIEMLELVLKTFLSVGLAYVGFGVMGYLIGQIAAIVVSSFLILRYFFKTRSFYPKPRIELSALKDYYGFGFWVTLKSVLNFIGSNADIILIGKFFPVASLGSYNFAKKIIQEPRGKLSNIFEKVAFPSFSMILNKQGERNLKLEIFKKKYLYFLKVISLIGFPLFGFILISAPTMVGLFFQPKWEDSILLIQIFCVSAMFELVSSGFSSTALYSLGLPKKVTKVDMVVTPVRLILILTLGLYTDYVESIAVLYVTLVMIKVVVLQNIINKKTNLSFGRIFQNIKTQFFSTVLAIVVFYGFTYFYNGQVLFGISFYLSIIIICYYTFSRKEIRFAIKDFKRAF